MEHGFTALATSSATLLGLVLVAASFWVIMLLHHQGGTSEQAK